jgi:cysteinyl-tRNA synthetase
MDADCNTADGISVIFEMVRDINTATATGNDPSKGLAKDCLAIFDELNDVLGLVYTTEDSGDDDLEQKVESMIAARAEAKKAKNWAEADRIRDELKDMGIIITDTPQGVKWKKA